MQNGIHKNPHTIPSSTYLGINLYNYVWAGIRILKMGYGAPFMISFHRRSELYKRLVLSPQRKREELIYDESAGDEVKW